jgi:hypothetical protein
LEGKRKENEMDEKIFVGLVVDWEKGTYEVYLVNPTGRRYKRVEVYTGAYCSGDNELLETSRAIKDLGELKPYSWVFLEGSGVDSFDFVIWYWLDLIPADENATVEKLCFYLPKYGYAMCYDKVKEYLPIIEKTGPRIEVSVRNGPETIDDGVKINRQDKRTPGIIDFRKE